MKKICENCKQLFECNMENITQCHCYSVQINEIEKLKIETAFSDCLCNDCLKKMVYKKTEKPSN